MAALYFHALRPEDKVAVKPHAGPVLHAIHYLMGNQTLDQLQRFRGLGGVQSYPSRTKDAIPVDFSTGSVGLGVAVTAFTSTDRSEEHTSELQSLLRNTYAHVCLHNTKPYQKTPSSRRT